MKGEAFFPKGSSRILVVHRPDWQLFADVNVQKWKMEEFVDDE